MDWVILAFIGFGLVMLLAPLVLRDDYRTVVLRRLCPSAMASRQATANTRTTTTTTLAKEEQAAIRAYIHQALAPCTRVRLHVCQSFFCARIQGS